MLRVDVGDIITNRRDVPMGRVTAIYQEDGKTIVVLDDDHEVVLSSCEEVLDLTCGKRHIRSLMH